MGAEVEGRLPRPRVARGDDLVEGPHVDKVEELGEELDGEGGVDAAPPQEVHGGGEDVHDPGDHLIGAVLVGLEQHLRQIFMRIVQGDQAARTKPPIYIDMKLRSSIRSF